MATHQSTIAPAVEYRDILGYPGYRIGTDGSVWTRLRRVGLGIGNGSRVELGEEWSVIKPATKRGYKRVYLSDGTARRWFFAHVLVLEAFVGPRPCGKQVCHNNGDPADNRLANLRWGTPKENSADSIAHGRILRGNQVTTSKLTEDAVRRIRERVASGVSMKQVAKEFGVSDVNVSQIVRKRTWRHV